MILFDDSLLYFDNNKKFNPRVFTRIFLTFPKKNNDHLKVAEFMVLTVSCLK